MVFVCFDLPLDNSSPEDTFADAAIFLALREAPFGPSLADNRLLAKGVDGLEVSGVGIGVTSVDDPLVFGVCCWPRKDANVRLNKPISN